MAPNWHGEPECAVLVATWELTVECFSFRLSLLRPPSSCPAPAPRKGCLIASRGCCSLSLGRRLKPRPGACFNWRSSFLAEAVFLFPFVSKAALFPPGVNPGPSSSLSPVSLDSSGRSSHWRAPVTTGNSYNCAFLESRLPAPGDQETGQNFQLPPKKGTPAFSFPFFGLCCCCSSV